MNRLTFIIFIFSGLYAQCDDYNEFNCSNDDSCEWVQNLEIENCHDILDCTGGCTWQDCEAIEGCWWHFGTAYYDPSGCYGEHEVNNSYCEEIIMPECSEMTESECASNSGCEWVENIELESCNDINSQQECQSLGCSWYSGNYYACSICCWGEYELDSSYCQEIPVQECSEIESESDCNSSEQCNWVEGQVNCNNLENELQCSYNNCDWIEDYEWSACSNYNSASECSWANANGGNGEWSWNRTQWQDTCSGGSFQLDTSYCFGDSSFCEEINYLLGDINNDSNINIQDVIQVVNLILNQEYNNIADMNNDQIINIIDVIQIIDVILNGEA